MKKVPIETRHLFAPLHNKLIELLKSLEPEDWNKQTVAKKWVVKDVVSHILDGQLRALSIQKDRYFGETPPEMEGYQDLVKWLNQLNNEWVQATKRLSPNILIFLLESVGPSATEYYESLDPWDEAIFSVAWAGESTSYNWMHIAREYSEYWHHQQQIRDAVGHQGIMTKEFFHPVMDIFFQGLPLTFKDVHAEVGTLVETIIESDEGGSWHLIKRAEKWELIDDADTTPSASVTIPKDIAWVLFSKSIRPNEILDKVTIQGDFRLGRQVLEMVSVMA